MKSMAIILATVLAVTVAPQPVFAQTKPAPSGASTGALLTLRVCNRSGRNATVAVSYIEVGSTVFVNRGWYDVADGACNDMVTTDNANFYFYADATDGSGRRWSGDHTLCVQYPGPYTFLSDRSPDCRPGQETRNFVASHATEPGVYTWTLNP